MKHIHVIILITLSILFTHKGYSQQKSKDKGSIASWDSTLVHDYKKYVMAMNWNDNTVARNALYDMIVQTSKAADSIIFSLAYLYYQDRYYASAALVCQELLAKAPKNVDYLNIFAVSLEAIGALDKALDSYETLYLLSDDTSILYKVAFLQYHLDKHNEGLTNVDILLTRPDIKELQVSFKTEREESKNYIMELAVINLKGLLYEKMDEIQQAKKAYEEALGLDPDFIPAKENLTRLK